MRFSQRKTIVLLCLLLVSSATGTIILILNREIPSEILQDPDPRLRVNSDTVHSFDDETRKVADELKTVIRKVDRPLKIFGLGMAAPQIGYDKRIAVLKNSYGEYFVVVNPEIVEEKWHFLSPSTCFSLKGMHFLERPFWMKVTYQDLNGNSQEIILRGPKAAVMKQEIDHLNGMLLTDY